VSGPKSLTEKITAPRSGCPRFRVKDAGARPCSSERWTGDSGLNRPMWRLRGLGTWRPITQCRFLMDRSLSRTAWLRRPYLSAQYPRQVSASPAAAGFTHKSRFNGRLQLGPGLVPPSSWSLSPGIGPATICAQNWSDVQALTRFISRQLNLREFLRSWERLPAHLWRTRDSGVPPVVLAILTNVCC
jgi:hypothetical protein